MSIEAPEWGCCSSGDQSKEDFKLCHVCNKAFHLACLFGNTTDGQGSVWTCPLCKNSTPKQVKKDNTEVRPRGSCNVTLRNKPKQDPTRHEMPSPPVEGKLPVTRSEVHSIIQEVVKAENSGLLAKLGSMVKDILHVQLQSLQQEVKEMRESMNFMSCQYDELLKENQKARDEMKELNLQNTSLSSTVQSLTSRVISLEQSARMNNLEIQCVPEKKNENLLSTITLIGTAVNCKVAEETIAHCTRVAKSNRDSTRARSIIVQFTSPKHRDNYLAAAIAFNKGKPASEKLNTSHLKISGEKKPIYISEHLCPFLKSLHAAARQKAKEKAYKYVWVRAGKIYMRKSDDSEYKLIRDMETLNKIV